jgi:hypothetical protein
MFYLEQRIFTRNIGRRRGERYWIAEDWKRLDYSYPTREACDRDIADLKKGDDDADIVKFRYRAVFVSE